MNQKPFYIKGVIEGNNSVLFRNGKEHVFYEKLSNTIHRGKKDQLKSLQNKVERIDYNPQFESETLQEKRNEALEGLVLNVTESCNLNCGYCIFSENYIGERKHNPSKMNFETAKKGVDFFLPKATKPVLISFYGGEPLNNMKLIRDVVDYTTKKYPSENVSFSMTTNFYDVEKHLKTIVNRNMNILVSLDGPKQIHDENRVNQNGEPTWDKVMRNLKELEEYSPGYLDDHVGASVTCAKTENLEKIVKFFLKKSPIRVFRIGGIEKKGLKETTSQRSTTFPINKLSSEFLKYVQDERVIPDPYRLLFEQQLTLMTMRSKKKLPKQIKLAGSCYPGKRKLYVDTKGKLYMCEKFGGRMPIGDLNEGIRNDLVDSAIENFTAIRNQICTNNCWAQRVCTPCIQSSKDIQEGISTRGLEQTCENSKLNLLITLALYSQISQTNNNYLNEINQPQLNKSEDKNESRN